MIDVYVYVLVYYKTVRNVQNGNEIHSLKFTQFFSFSYSSSNTYTYATLTSSLAILLACMCVRSSYMSLSLFLFTHCSSKHMSGMASHMALTYKRSRKLSTSNVFVSISDVWFPSHLLVWLVKWIGVPFGSHFVSFGLWVSLSIKKIIKWWGLCTFASLHWCLCDVMICVLYMIWAEKYMKMVVIKHRSMCEIQRRGGRRQIYWPNACALAYVCVLALIS